MPCTTALEAGTTGRVLDMFAIFGTGVVVAACIAAVIIMYLIFRLEQGEEE